MNRLRENPNLSALAANMLGAAYAVVGQEAAARELIMGMKTYVNHNSHYQNTFGSELRDKAMRVEALIRIGENAEAFKLINEGRKARQRKLDEHTRNSLCIVQPATVYAAVPTTTKGIVLVINRKQCKSCGNKNNR